MWAFGHPAFFGMWNRTKPSSASELWCHPRSPLHFAARNVDPTSRRTLGWAELIVCLSVSVCLYACVVVFAWGSARDPGKLKQSACTRTRLAWGGVWARGRGGVWRALARPVVSAARAVAGPREPCRGGARLFIFGVARYKNETIDLSVCHSGL